MAIRKENKEEISSLLLPEGFVWPDLMLWLLTEVFVEVWCILQLGWWVFFVFKS